MTKTFKKRIATFLVALMMLCTMGTSVAYAAEVETPETTETSGDVETRAGVETFYLNNNYEVGSFTFSGNNTTPKKTVQGRYLYTYLKMKRASSDAGSSSSSIKVTVKILDASTLNQIGSSKTYIIKPGSSIDGGFETDLGRTGRKIYIKLSATTYGSSSNTERSVSVQRFMVNTSNTKGTYWD